MRIKNQNELAQFKKTVEKFSGSAVFVDARSGEKFDLGISAEKEKVFELLLSDINENLELFLENREDEQTVFAFLHWLDSEQTR